MSAPERELEGRRVVVTGASRGIGATIAGELARGGASLGLVARNAERLEEVARAVAAEHGAKVVFRVADVTDRAAVHAAIAAIDAELGGLDGLVNNAGSNGDSKPFLEYDPLEFGSLIELNLLGVANVTRAALPALLREGGSIVNVASMAGKMGVPMWSAYCAAKHGVLGLTKALAHEVARQDVRVNAVCPGFVQTDMMSDPQLEGWAGHLGMTRRQLVKEVILRSAPQARFVEASSVASMVSFLLSSRAADITGQAINVSCGIGDY
jgi:NAD(P)-dependent dehydrogenase (short-subunit alcohol dehydrogenase family)